MILFPAIDILDGRAVRLRQGSYDDVTKYHDDPAQQASVFAEAGAKWIHVVDLNGAKEGRAVNQSTITRIIEESGVNVEVGGGMRSIEIIDSYIEAGAKRIVLGTKLARDPNFAKEAANRFGEMIVAGIDARDAYVSVSGWTEAESIPADDLVARLKDLGICHLVYTDISRDGMQSGIDVQRYLELSKIAGFKVVASGGVASIEDIKALAAHPQAIEGAIVGKAIYEGRLDVREALAVVAGAADGGTAAGEADGASTAGATTDSPLGVAAGAATRAAATPPLGTSGEGIN